MMEESLPQLFPSPLSPSLPPLPPAAVLILRLLRCCTSQARGRTRMPHLLGRFCRAQTGEKERWGGRPHTCRAGAQRPGHPHRPAFLPREDEKGAVRLVIEGFGGGDFGLSTCLSSHSPTERSPPPPPRGSPLSQAMSGPLSLRIQRWVHCSPFLPELGIRGQVQAGGSVLPSTATEGGSAGVGREERGRGRDQTGVRRRSWRGGRGKTHTGENAGS